RWRVVRFHRGSSQKSRTHTDTEEATMAISVEPEMSPHLVVDNAAAAIDFYVRAFDAEEVGRVPCPGGKLIHASVRLNGFPLLLNAFSPEMPGGKVTTSTSCGGSPV